MHYFILLFAIFPLFALELKTQANTTLKFTTIEGLRVSEHCQKTCLALRDYRSVGPLKRLKGNPASEFCIQVGGEDKVASHPNLDQDSVCIFKDGSYILSWDLYRKNNEAQK